MNTHIQKKGIVHQYHIKFKLFLTVFLSPSSFLLLYRFVLLTGSQSSTAWEISLLLARFFCRQKDDPTGNLRPLHCYVTKDTVYVSTLLKRLKRGMKTMLAFVIRDRPTRITHNRLTSGGPTCWIAGHRLGGDSIVSFRPVFKSMAPSMKSFTFPTSFSSYRWGKSGDKRESSSNWWQNWTRWKFPTPVDAEAFVSSLFLFFIVVKYLNNL